jgi:hypothetical protein
MYILHPQRHPFSRSYGVNLPNSLTKVLPFALVSSTHPPVSVCGTGTQASSLRGFSWQLGATTSALPRPLHASTSGCGFPCTPHRPTRLAPLFHSGGWPTLLRLPFALPRWFRNINRMSIAYAFRPRLRPD